MRMLYVCDFPPSHAAGGSILLARLLDGYPTSSLIVLTGSHASDLSTKQGRLACRHLTFPTSKGWGRWGLGRLRVALDWLRLPLLTLSAIRVIRRHSIQTMMTLLHGRFYFAVWAAARITRTPYVVFVHDYYLNGEASIGQKLIRAASRTVLNDAARVFAVSAGMQQKIKDELGVNSDLQLPATKAQVPRNQRNWEVHNEHLNIVYAGAITSVVEDCLDLLTQIVKSGALKECGIASATLQLFSSMSPDKLLSHGWNHPDVHVGSWIPQTQLPQALSDSDILFLPFSFHESARETTETAFPSKTADYLASGTPILVFGPKYSTIVKYARDQGFAEVVDEFNAAALVLGIQSVALSPSRQKELTTRSLATFAKNHDIDLQRREFGLCLREIVCSSAATSRVR